jgi:hypothetical protein
VQSSQATICVHQRLSAVWICGCALAAPGFILFIPSHFAIGPGAWNWRIAWEYGQFWPENAVLKKYKNLLTGGRVFHNLPPVAEP